MQRIFNNSESFLEQALKTIPLGSQTFSKSKIQYPYGVSPYFIQKGIGSKVWDVDGNQYIDFINALAAITLGYQDPDVNQAVLEQFNDGIIFSLPHPIEFKVAEKIVEMVPCAEMVRFGKNGSDATTAAVRLARAFTGRNHVAICGYHGWQDWFIGTTPRSLGVPRQTSDLSHLWKFNDLDSLQKIFKEYSGDVAAVILEPMNISDPLPGFLDQVKELTHQNGALLIFDETVTGFRFHNGGAQSLFDVTPDLATFGKGLANGYPLSAIAGKKEVMTLMEEVFFSTTFGGEALSLAAAYATMSKLQKEPVIDKLYTLGSRVKEHLQSSIKSSMCEDFLGVAGNPTWSFLMIKDTPDYNMWEIKTLFLQEMFQRGILTIGTHNISYSHDNEDINSLCNAYDETIEIIVKAVRKKNLHKVLRCEPLQPLFKVR